MSLHLRTHTVRHKAALKQRHSPTYVASSRRCSYFTRRRITLRSRFTCFQFHALPPRPVRLEGTVFAELVLCPPRTSIPAVARWVRGTTICGHAVVVSGSGVVKSTHGDALGSHRSGRLQCESAAVAPSAYRPRSRTLHKRAVEEQPPAARLNTNR